MSIPGFIYIIGSVLAIVIALRWSLNEYRKSITAEGMCILAVIAFFAGLLSWLLVFLSLLFKYGDKVVIKRKED